MQFRIQDIYKARQLRDLGLRWEPQPGHYVWDEKKLIKQQSPFQEGVYFILDLKHFLRRSGTLDRLKQSMVWLPTWYDARLILQTMEVDDKRVAKTLQSHSAIEQNQELHILYELIAAQLQSTFHISSQTAEQS